MNSSNSDRHKGGGSNRPMHGKDLDHMYLSVSPLDRIKLLQWENYIRAACKIQRVYRRWHFRSVNAQKSRRSQFGENKSTQKQSAIDPHTALNNIMNDCSTEEEKLHLWRSVIEIRRVRPQYSTDSCLRALIECKGDLPRALIVTGNPAFGWRNSDNLSEENRIKFLPSSSSSSFSRDDRKHSPDRHNNNNNNNNHSPARGGIRHLRDYKLSIAQRELEGRTRGGQGDRNGDRDRDRDRGRSGTIDVSAVVAKVYFSKQYIQ